MKWGYSDGKKNGKRTASDEVMDDLITARKKIKEASDRYKTASENVERAEKARNRQSENFMNYIDGDTGVPGMYNTLGNLLNEANKDLDKAYDERRTAAKEYSDADKDYRRKISKGATWLLKQNWMQNTSINQFIKGKKSTKTNGGGKRR